MKFLLTSAGFMNQSISQALVDLAGKPASEIKFIFVPTAANIEEGDKEWLINDYRQIAAQGFKSVDIIDIAAVSKEIWLPRLEAADVICFGGGNQQFLVKVMNESGFANEAPRFLKDRVYMGISAGSMALCQPISPELLNVVYHDDTFSDDLSQPLKLADLIFLPHLNSEYFPQVRKEIIESLPNHFAYPIYALDDNSALAITDAAISVISEGTWIKA